MTTDEKLRQLRKKELQKRIFNIIVLGAIIIGIYDFYLFILLPQINLPGESVPIMGREHIPIGSPAVVYNSVPPTSGPHYPVAIKSGVYSHKVQDEYMVHSLEHGRILIAYKPSFDQQTVRQLIIDANQGACPIIIEPYPDLDADIALAAWGRLDKFSVQELTYERIQKFILAFEFKGPEYVPCPDSTSNTIVP